jgi:hypothetical protein
MTPFHIHADVDRLDLQQVMNDLLIIVCLRFLINFFWTWADLVSILGGVCDL